MRGQRFHGRVRAFPGETQPTVALEQLSPRLVQLPVLEELASALMLLASFGPRWRQREPPQRWTSARGLAVVQLKVLSATPLVVAGLLLRAW